jgi:thiamine biosynthesis lipoprotein
VAAGEEAADGAAWRTVVHAMAMPFTLDIVRGDDLVVGGERPDEAAFARAAAAFGADLAWADDVFSLWRPDTPLSRLARGEIAVEDCPPAVGEVLAECERYREVTDGAFDARRPDGVLDPTGIVKTWAVARAAWRIEAVGAAGWMIGASGDVLVSGVGPDDGPWRIGLADPRVGGDVQSGPLLDVVRLGEGIDAPHRALASSGTAQHGEHIWNPATGRMESAFVQASVVGGDLVECDAWATAIVAGGETVATAAQRHGLEVFCVAPAAADDASGEVRAVVSQGWPGLA